MKKLLIILLSALSLAAFAQQKKVAVYVTGQESGINKVLGDQLVAAFAKSGRYIAIERTASFLTELSKEQNYQRTGAVGDNEIARLGEQFGVQLVCVADVSDVFGEKYVSARLIDVESAEVANTSNASSPLNSMAELLKVTDKLTKELTAKTVQEKAAEQEALKREQEEIEKSLLDGFKNGYIKCGNLFATLSWSRVSRPCDVIDITNGLHSAGKDWRLPTIQELSLVKQACKNYYNNKESYQKISTAQIEQLKKIFEGETFWVRSGSGREMFCYDVVSYVTKDGTCHSLSSGESYNAAILLVRDAK